MTLNGAIMQLVEIRNHPMCPVIFKPALNKVIETISELEEKLIETISEPEEEPQPSKDAIAGRIEQLPPAQLGTNLAEVGTDCISRQAAIDALDEQIAQCNKAIKSFALSMKDEYAAKVEKASLTAFRERLEYLPPAQPEPCEDAVSRKDCLQALSHLMDVEGFRDGWAVSRANVECMLKAMPPVTPKQSLDIDKVSKEVLNAISKWLNSQDDKRDVLNAIKDVLSPTRGRSERCQNLKRLKSVNR